MPKWLLVILILAILAFTALITYTLSNKNSVRKSELDAAVNQAKHQYRLKRERGEDFTNGPCLSNALMPGWVADIVHNPRQDVDDLKENQCPAFMEGRASHFVELDLGGNLIRAR